MAISYVTLWKSSGTYLGELMSMNSTGFFWTNDRSMRTSCMQMLHSPSYRTWTMEAIYSTVTIKLKHHTAQETLRIIIMGNLSYPSKGTKHFTKCFFFDQARYSLTQILHKFVLVHAWLKNDDHIWIACESFSYVTQHLSRLNTYSPVSNIMFDWL